jgi:hypothetical protein
MIPSSSAVRIGGTTKSELLAALRGRGVQLNEAAEALFADERFTVLEGARVVEIAAVSVGELGFDAGATYAELIARAREREWVQCPLELGPRLRLELVEPSVDDEPGSGKAPRGAITVASAPLDDSDETPKGFYLRRVGGVAWLRGYWSWAGHVFVPEDVFVFARRA